MVLIQFGTVALATVLYRISPLHPLARFPGPFMWKVTSLKLAQMVWSGKRHIVIIDMHKKYGTVVRTGPNTLSFNSHAAVSPIYSSAVAFNKSNAYIPGKMHGTGLFFIQDRDEHSVRRRHWAPAFKPAAVASYKPVIERRVNQMVDCIAERQTSEGVSLSDVFAHWSYDVMGDLTFGGSSEIEMMKLGDTGNYVESGQLATAVFETLGEVPSLFDLLWYLPVTKTIGLLENFAAGLLERRLNDTAASDKDLTALLARITQMGTRSDSKVELTKEDLRIESLFAIQAGSDTTSGVLTFAFYHLLKHKSAYERLQAELDDAFPNPTDSLDVEILSKLPYLNAVVDESCRLGTPFPGLPRVVPDGGAMVDGEFIPGGTIIAVNPWAQMQSEDNFYPDPEIFRPERWLPGGLGPNSRASKSAILSFSVGPFSCLGKPLALQELRQVISKLLLTYDLKYAPSFDSAKFEEGTHNMRTTIFNYPLSVVAIPRRR
ncbi:cytochrome P450 [Obba rivulosa]|uniref:Cytochrome P450 n=1 Tax=Obba rivulosa TaxID=1052685 RepID=A0A8E2AS82_9APHY|nr:cytochrome P450 [Obba rivulosa]